MAISLFPVTPDFAAEVGDVDLSQPLATEDVEAIKQAFWKYAVLIFPEQQLTQDQHAEVAKHFGPLQPATFSGYRGKTKRRVSSQLADVSNLDEKSEVWSTDSRARMFHLGNQLWHTDSSFLHVPALASLLYSRMIAPIGGHTEFVDERAAYDALPESMKRRIDGLVVEHSIFYSRAKIGYTEFSDEERAALPPVKQVLVRTIPENGRKSLYLSAHAGRIVGMPEDEGRALLEELTAHATQRQFVYTHRWRQYELVMWDNRCTMHHGTNFDDLRWKRDMQRATVSEPANSCELAARSATVA